MGEEYERPKSGMNANSLRRDSANIALARAHTEIEVREQPKLLMCVLPADGQGEAKEGRRDLIGLEVWMGELVGIVE